METAELLAIMAELKKNGGLEGLRQGFAQVLEPAASQPFSAALAGELGDRCKVLQDQAGASLPASSRRVALNLLVLPGLDLAGALALMRNEPPAIKDDVSLPLITMELV